MSFPRYPKYKESGVEWLGEVPEHWEQCRLAVMFRQVAQAGNDGLPILSVSIHHGVSDEELDDDEVERKVTRSDDRSKYKKVEPGDLVYNMMRAWQGGFGTVTVTGMVSPAYVVARPTSKFSTSFVERLLRTPPAVEQMRRLSRGITDFRLRLYWEEFKTIRIPVPPEVEQHLISAFLDGETAKIDELVAEQRRLIELLKEKRQAVISHVVTKGLNPHAPMKPSGIEWLGDVPEHWAIPPLYVRYEQVLGKMLDQNKMTGEHPMPYLRNLDVRWDYCNVDDLPIMDIRPEEIERFTVRKGDLLTVEGRELGRAAIWSGEDNVVAFQKALHRLRPLDRSEHVRYFYYTLVFANATNVFMADQSPNEIPHLTGEQFRTYRFPKPPYDEQVDIVEYLDREIEAFDLLVTEADRAIELLHERRAAVISAAVTGKIDMRGLAATEAR